MENDMKKSLYQFWILFLLFTLPMHLIYSQSNIVEFDSSKWNIINGEQKEYLGRKALRGFAILKDVEFENGIIEFDIAVNGERSYPGIHFRMQSRSDYEHFYIRPHRAHYYSDALQYTPVFGNVAAWQLYNGEGFTSAALQKWFMTQNSDLILAKGMASKKFIIWSDFTHIVTSNCAVETKKC